MASVEFVQIDCFEVTVEEVDILVEVLVFGVGPMGKDTFVDWEGGMRLETAVLVYKKVDTHCCNESADLGLAMTSSGGGRFDPGLAAAVVDAFDDAGGGGVVSK